MQGSLEIRVQGRVEIENMSSKVLSCADLMEKTKEHLRSVLISEKGGVALDRLERDYRELVSSFRC